MSSYRFPDSEGGFDFFQQGTGDKSRSRGIIGNTMMSAVYSWGYYFSLARSYYTGEGLKAPVFVFDFLGKMGSVISDQPYLNVQEVRGFANWTGVRLWFVER